MLSTTVVDLRKFRVIEQFGLLQQCGENWQELREVVFWTLQLLGVDED